MLDEHERRYLITATDKTRITAILEAFKNPDQRAGADRIMALHQEALNDPTSKPAALAISSIAASSAAAAMSDSPFSLNSLAAGAADTIGVIATLGLGPGVAMAASVAASAVAMHTHVDVSWS